MITVYLSGKITGVDELNAPKFAKYQRLLEAKGYKVINPLNLLPQDQPYTYQQYMREDIKWLVAESDIMAQLDDWQDSKGARFEKDTCDITGIPYMDVEQLLKLPANHVKTLIDNSKFKAA